MKNHLVDLYNARHILNNQRQEQEKVEQSRAPKRRRECSPYRPRPRPRAFRRGIQKEQFPVKAHVPANMNKYDRTINPSIWLEDYNLASRMAGLKDDHLII